MPEHSPEPWNIVKDTYVTHEGDGKDPACWIENSDCRFIAETEYADRPPETARADARRIVACVNAMAGVSIDDVEDMARLRPSWNALGDEIKRFLAAERARENTAAAG